MNAETAQAVDPDQHGHDLSWLPPGPHTVDILKILPGDRRYELVDGQLIIMSAQTLRHQGVLAEICFALRDVVPEGWTTIFAPGFSRNRANYRVPDVAICTVEAASSNVEGDHLKPNEVLLLAEVVGESTVLTDRVTKPIEYASTGVPHCLRVETELLGAGREALSAREHRESAPGVRV